MASKSGTISLPEGTIFWKATYPPKPAKDRNILFLHAGVADHTQWDEQVDEFTSKGWTCIVVDRFGFGKSLLSDTYIAQNPRSAVDHNQHWAAVAAAALSNNGSGKLVVVGLSMGGMSAVEFAIARPDLVQGLVVVAGGVRDFDYNPPEDERRLCQEGERLAQANDLEKLVQHIVHFWGDGPRQAQGRSPQSVRDKLTIWNKEICDREFSRDGGEQPTVEPEKPVPAQLELIQQPTVVAWGSYDETCTNDAMKFLASKIPGAELTEFPTAHMVNLELPKEFNAWLQTYLAKNFPE